MKSKLRKVIANIISAPIPSKKMRREVRRTLTGNGKNKITKLIQAKWNEDCRCAHLTPQHRELYTIIHSFRYRAKGSFPNIVNPESYNDRIAWLMLFDQNPLLTICSDKYEVRRFVEKRIGKKYLNTLYGAYDSFEEIDIDQLPTSFVIKTNHDSGTVILVKDKAEWDQEHSRKQLTKALKSPYGYEKGEWTYRSIPPKIIVEKYLGQLGDLRLPDFKFHCVDGMVGWFQYIYDRGQQTKETIYDRNFKPLPLHLDEAFIQTNSNIDCPENWASLVEKAEQLALGFKYVRVDLYNIENKIIFGELTFFPMSGCYSTADNNTFGNMMSFDQSTILPPIYNEKSPATVTDEMLV